MKVGIIGFGGAGTAHYRYFSCVAGCKVVSVYDLKAAGRARATALDPSLIVCATLESFWEHVDAVSVCAPDDTHSAYIVEALARDIHVLCEKPLTDSEEGIRAILEATSSSRATLAVLHQMRFVPLFEKMKRALDSGTIGRLSYLEGYYVHDLTERAFTYDDWRRSGNATPMVYAGCHFVDLLRWLLREDPCEVFAVSNHLACPEYPEADMTVALMRFPSSTVGKVLVSIGTAGPQDHSVRLYGDRGSIENGALFRRDGSWESTLHQPMLLHRALLRDSRLTPRGRAQAALSQLSRHGRARLLTTVFEGLRRLGPSPGTQYGPRYLPVRLYEHQLACIAAVEDFVEAARTGAPPRCTASDSASTVLACLAALSASRTNELTQVPPLSAVLPTRGELRV